MYKIIIFAVLASISTIAASASFPHKTVSYTSVMDSPTGWKDKTESYLSFDGKNSITAEWLTQQSPEGTSRIFYLTRAGFSYELDIDSEQCTKMNISDVQDMVEDPIKLAQDMKKQLNLKKSGVCEGSGFAGVKYSSSLGEVCLYKDVFMLWSNIMGSKTVVSNIRFDEKLPAGKITLPEGVECK